MISKPHAQSEERAATADALRLRSQQRSRRTIEPASGNPKADISQVSGKSLTNNIHDLDCDHEGKNAGKKCVQRAAAVGAIFALIMVMMERPLAAAVLGMVVIEVKGDRGREISRAGEW